MCISVAQQKICRTICYTLMQPIVNIKIGGKYVVIVEYIFFLIPFILFLLCKSVLKYC